MQFLFNTVMTIMKFLILLVFCFGAKACFDKTIANKCGVGYYDNEEDVTNENNIIRPCSVDDYKCMRNFLAENSKCIPCYNPIKEPLHLPQTTVYFSYANITFTYTNYTSSGLSNATIITFEYNKITGNLVVAIEIPALKIIIPKLLIKFRRPGQESIVKSDFAYVIYKSVIYTATISKDGKLNKSGIQPGFVGEDYPEFYIGPKACTSKDPIATAAYAGLLANIPLGVRNVNVFLPRLYVTLFIQSICDFGLDLNNMS